MEKKGIKYVLNPGDGAFYGPKLDFKLRDSMNRIWQCGTIQLDMNLPERFDLTYVSETGEKIRPIMLHRALFGSIERFIGIITEHFAGAFPLWLAPRQMVIIPVNNAAHIEYAKAVKEELEAHNIRVSIDDREEKLSYRMREAQLNKIPYNLILGDKERDNEEMSYRKFGSDETTTLSKDEFIKLLNQEIESLGN